MYQQRALRDLDGAISPGGLSDPLVDEEIVRLSSTLRDSLCKTSPLDCGAYHTMRPILRYLGLLTSPIMHSSFYKAVSDRIISPSPHIAVAGAADHSWTIPTSPIYQHVASPKSHVTIYDICPTPLALNLASASLQKLSINTQIHDLRARIEGDTYDLIVTDALLTQFTEEDDRMKVLSSWKQALKQDGIIATTIHMRRLHTPHADRQGFIDTAVRLFEEQDASRLFACSPEEFRQLIELHSTSLKGRAYETLDQVKDEIEAAGLILREVSELPMKSPTGNILPYLGLVITHKDA